jgi:hypothetical protein
MCLETNSTWQDCACRITTVKWCEEGLAEGDWEKCHHRKGFGRRRGGKCGKRSCLGPVENVGVAVERDVEDSCSGWEYSPDLKARVLSELLKGIMWRRSPG